MQTTAQHTDPLPAPRSGWTAKSSASSLKRSFVRSLLQFFVIAVLAVGSYLLISHFLLQSVRVVGVSMVPTLHNADHYLLNRWVYYLRSPRRSEIVVLRDPADHGFSVKRVVAQGGDTVYLKEGSVYLNGQKLDEAYLPAGTPTFTGDGTREQLFKCPPGQYFVLGDNRNSSVDSRSYGLVPRQNILGLLVY